MVIIVDVGDDGDEGSVTNHPSMVIIVDGEEDDNKVSPRITSFVYVVMYLWEKIYKHRKSAKLDLCLFLSFCLLAFSSGHHSD